MSRDRYLLSATTNTLSVVTLVVVVVFRRYCIIASLTVDCIITHILHFCTYAINLFIGYLKLVYTVNLLILI